MSTALQLYEEPELYHHALADGYFTLAHRELTKERRWRELHHPLSLLPEVIRDCPRNLDSYLSQAEFARERRLLVNLSRVGVLWVDCDTYSTPAYSDHHPEQVAGAVRLHCEDIGLPTPSIIMFSGRGLYLKWVLMSPLQATDLPRWNAVQAMLTLAFDEFGADHGARDGSRVLRLVGTVNTKSGEYTRILWENRQGGELVRYDFDMLADELLVEQEGIEEPPSTVISPVWENRALVQRDVHRQTRLTRQTLHWARLRDIRTLLKLRGWPEPVPGYQDKCLWLATCSLAWAVQPPQLRQEARQLAAEFCPSWRPIEAMAVLSTTLQRAEAASMGKAIQLDGKQRDPRYIFKNDTLINSLRITSDEMQHMATLIDSAEKRRRNRELKERQRREAGAVERTLYLGAAEDRRTTARLMAAQGRGVREIARDLGVAAMTISRYLEVGDHG